jgi:hypothetical protein
LSADGRVLGIDDRTGHVQAGGVARGFHVPEQLARRVLGIRDCRDERDEEDSDSPSDQGLTTRPLLAGRALSGSSALFVLVLCFCHFRHSISSPIAQREIDAAASHWPFQPA